MSATCPVGSYGANGVGLSDMGGNVREWMEDCWEGDCRRRVLRGGSWFDEAEWGGADAQNWASADLRSTYFGFRVVGCQRRIAPAGHRARYASKAAGFVLSRIDSQNTTSPRVGSAAGALTVMVTGGAAVAAALNRAAAADASLCGGRAPSYCWLMIRCVLVRC